MHKTGRASGAPIISNAANFSDQCAVANFLGCDIGEVNVDRLAVHVLALARNVAADFFQERVGSGRAIAANNVDWCALTQIGVKFPNEIDDLGVYLDDFIATPIAQQIIDLLHG